MKKNIVIIILIIISLGLGVGLFITNRELSNQKEEYKDEIKELEEKIDSYKKAETSSNENYNNDNDNDDYYNDYNEKEDYETNEDYNLSQLSFSEFEKKLEEEESFTILFSQTNCSHCIVFKPVLKNIIDTKKITIYELDIQKMETNDLVRLKEMITIQGTPTLTYIKNGVVKNNLIGYREENAVLEFLQNEGLID